MFKRANHNKPAMSDAMNCGQ